MSPSVTGFTANPWAVTMVLTVCFYRIVGITKMTLRSCSCGPLQFWTSHNPWSFCANPKLCASSSLIFLTCLLYLHSVESVDPCIGGAVMTDLLTAALLDSGVAISNSNGSSQLIGGTTRTLCRKFTSPIEVFDGVGWAGSSDRVMSASDNVCVAEGGEPWTTLTFHFFHGWSK